MALNRDNFKKVGAHTWYYKTDDTAAQVDAANYFQGVADLLRMGDVIDRVTVTNLDASNEAFSTGGRHRVNSLSLSAGVWTVDTTNATADSTIDSD